MYPYSVQNPTEWTLQGSNDGTVWSNIGVPYTFTAWSDGTPVTFNVESVHIAHTYWRLFITKKQESGQQYCGIRELIFFSTKHGTQVNLATAYPTSTNRFKVVMTDTLGNPIDMSESELTWRYNITLTNGLSVVNLGVYDVSRNPSNFALGVLTGVTESFPVVS
jgi:hypothetical protein